MYAFEDIIKKNQNIRISYSHTLHVLHFKHLFQPVFSALLIFI